MILSTPHLLALATSFQGAGYSEVRDDVAVYWSRAGFKWNRPALPTPTRTPG